MSAPPCGVNGVGQATQAVVVDAPLGGKLPPVGMDVERLGGDEAYTTVRPPHIEGNVAFRHLTLWGALAQPDGRHQHAVGQSQARHSQRLKQGLRVPLSSSMLSHLLPCMGNAQRVEDYPRAISSGDSSPRRRVWGWQASSPEGRTDMCTPRCTRTTDCTPC